MLVEEFGIIGGLQGFATDTGVSARIGGGADRGKRGPIVKESHGYGEEAQRMAMERKLRDWLWQKLRNWIWQKLRNCGGYMAMAKIGRAHV